MDGANGLGSGFVLAVLIAAVLVVERIGGIDQLSRRLFQVALAVAIAFAAIAGTTAFIRAPEYEEADSSFSSSSDEDFDEQQEDEEEEQREFFEKLANRSATRTMIHFAVGVVALVAGVAALRRWPTTALAAMLGGALLVIFGGVRGGSADDLNPLTAYFAAYSDAVGATLGQRSMTVGVVNFVVMLAGALGLLALGLLQWDEPRRASGATEPPAEMVP